MLKYLTSCVELRLSALKVTLAAFAGRSAANPPVAADAGDRRDRQTET